MYIVQFWKFGEDLCQSIMEILLSKFYFPEVKVADSCYFVLFVDYCGGFTLCFGEDNIDEVLNFK